MFCRANDAVIRSTRAKRKIQLKCPYHGSVDQPRCFEYFHKSYRDRWRGKGTEKLGFRSDGAFDAEGLSCTGADPCSIYALVTNGTRNGNYAARTLPSVLRGVP